MFSACLDTQTSGCKCPLGFRGDGVDKCEGMLRQIPRQVMKTNFVSAITNSLLVLITCGSDINECKEKVACQCSECSCKNTWGSYVCSCKGDLLYIRDHDTCISK